MYFDVAIIGDTQDAWAAADEAARLGCRTAVLRPDSSGQGIESGIAAITTIFGQPMQNASSWKDLSPRDLWTAAARCHQRQTAELCRLHSIENWQGKIRFTSPTSVEVTADRTTQAVDAHLFIIATGSVARHPVGLPFDQRMIFVPEDVRLLSSLPEKLIVLGGNRTARAFGRLFQLAGSSVATVNSHPQLDCETHHQGEVIALFQNSRQVTVRLSSDRELSADALLFAADRMGATSLLSLSSAGLETDEDGRLWCDSVGNTWLSSIAAVGEVVGFPEDLKNMTSAVRKLIASRFSNHPIKRRNDTVRQQKTRPEQLRTSANAASPNRPTHLKIFS